MDPIMIAMIAQGALGAGQAIKGMVDTAKAKKPTMGIPPAAQEALKIAKTAANRSGMPGQKIIEDKLASQAAQVANQVLRASGGTSAGIGGVAQVGQGLRDAMGNLAVQGAQFEAAADQNLQQQLGNMAGWQQKMFENNEMMPYMQSMEAARQLKDSGIQNMWGALSGYAQGESTKQMWNKYIESQKAGLGQPLTTNTGQPAARLFNPMTFTNIGQTVQAPVEQSIMPEGIFDPLYKGKLKPMMNFQGSF